MRETLFNWIAHLRPDFTALRGLDLFAGAGALGFELASRGAREVVMVEIDRRIAASLRTVRERLNAGTVRVVLGDAFAARIDPGEGFDVIFLDPPFDAGLDARALALAHGLAAPHALVYLESASALDPAQAHALGYQILRADRAGKVHFHLLLRRDAGIIATDSDRQRGFEP